METENKVVFEFERIEANILGFKIPLPKFSSDAGFVEVQVMQAMLLEGVGERFRIRVCNGRYPESYIKAFYLYGSPSYMIHL